LETNSAESKEETCHVGPLVHLVFKLVLGTVKNVESVKSTKSAVNFLGHPYDLQAVSIIHLGMGVNQR
jgi:hypothetical protein